MARSLNRVQLIGNLTRDPELRYTPSGAAVCTFGIATNRTWNTDTGEKREEVDFHNIVAWRKLAELCSQFLVKGRKVYVEGRLSTRNWTGQDGTQKSTTEVVIDDMILLDSRPSGAGHHTERTEVAEPEVEKSEEVVKATRLTKTSKKEEDEDSSTGSASNAVNAEQEKEPASESNDEEVAPDDIPF